MTRNTRTNMKDKIVSRELLTVFIVYSIFFILYVNMNEYSYQDINDSMKDEKYFSVEHKELYEKYYRYAMFSINKDDFVNNTMLMIEHTSSALVPALYQIINSDMNLSEMKEQLEYYNSLELRCYKTGSTRDSRNTDSYFTVIFTILLILIVSFTLNTYFKWVEVNEYNTILAGMLLIFISMIIMTIVGLYFYFFQ